MKLYLAIFIFAIELFLLRDSFAENHPTRYINNLPVQYKKSYDTLKDIEKDRVDSVKNEFIPVAAVEEKQDDIIKKNDYMKEDDVKEDDVKDDVINDDDMQDDDMKDDDIKDDYTKVNDNKADDIKIGDIKDDENEPVKSEKNVISAIGSDMSNLAVLTPADTSILKKAGINSHHIIGYVPVNSPNGHALVFPAGAVRIIGQQQFSINPVHKKKKKLFLRKQEEDENAEEEERGLRKRKRIRRRNSKGKLKRRRRHRGSNKRKRKSNRRGNNKQKQRYRNQYRKDRDSNNGDRYRHRSRSGSDNYRRNSHSQSQHRRQRVPVSSEQDYRDE